MRRLAPWIAIVALVASCGGSSTGGGSSTSTGRTSTTPAKTKGKGRLGDATESTSTHKGPLVLATAAPVTNVIAKGLAHCADEDLPANAANRTRVEAAAFCLTNKFRAANGRRPLKSNRRLRAAARAHASNMVANHFFSHTDPGGRDALARIKAARYMGRSQNWMVGENIASGQGDLGTPRSIVSAWINSPGHRRNLLNRRYRETGLALAPGTPSASSGDGGTWAQEFGQRSRVASARRR
jgi:uncharacterized protein YkwD